MIALRSENHHRQLNYLNMENQNENENRENFDMQQKTLRHRKIGYDRTRRTRGGNPQLDDDNKNHNIQRQTSGMTEKTISYDVLEGKLMSDLLAKNQSQMSDLQTNRNRTISNFAIELTKKPENTNLLIDDLHRMSIKSSHQIHSEAPLCFSRTASQENRPSLSPRITTDHFQNHQFKSESGYDSNLQLDELRSEINFAINNDETERNPKESTHKFDVTDQVEEPELIDNNTDDSSHHKHRLRRKWATFRRKNDANPSKPRKTMSKTKRFFRPLTLICGLLAFKSADKVSARLPCQPEVTIVRSFRPDAVIADACCGDKPYNSGEKGCCEANQFFSQVYDKGQQICCGGGLWDKRFKFWGFGELSK